MTDIAMLGIGIDTRPMQQGIDALGRLGVAARNAGAGANVAQAGMNAAAGASGKAAAQVGSAGAAAEQAGARFNSAGRLIDEYGRYVAAAGQSSSNAAQQVQQSAASANNSATAFGVLKAAVAAAASAYATLKIADSIKDMALAAARYETLGVAMTVVGKNAGYTQAQMEANAQALAKTGITMAESRQQTMRLVQAHIDLADSTKLARIAQDAAVIGNMNSTEAFAKLIHGIQTGQTDVLRTIGLNVSMEQSYKVYAKTLGTTADALTQNQKTQAVLNAVMEAGKDIAGAYEAAMDTAGKQLNSMKRYTEDLKTIQGEVFNDALSVAVMAYTDHLKDANGRVTELSRNNSLHEWGDTLSGILTGLLEGINNLAVGFAMVNNAADRSAAKYQIKKNANMMRDQVPGTLFGMALPGSKAADRVKEIDLWESNQMANADAKFDGNYNALDSRFGAVGRANNARRAAKKQSEEKRDDNSEKGYLARAAAVREAYKDAPIEVQQKAQQELADGYYKDKHVYKDTESTKEKKGKKPTDDRNTILADKMDAARDGLTAAKKAMDDEEKFNKFFLQNKQISEETYYDNRRRMLDEYEAAVQAAYKAEEKALGQVKVDAKDPRQVANLAKQKANAQRERDLKISGIEDDRKMIGLDERFTIPKKKFGEVSADGDRIEAKAQRDEQRIANDKATMNLSEYESMKQLGIVRQQEITDLTVVRDRMQAIADANPWDKDMQEKVAQVNARLGELATTSDVVGNKMRDIASSAFSSFFSDVLSGTKSVKQAFGDMAKSIIADMVKMQVQQAAMGASKWLASAVGGMFGSPAVASANGNAFSRGRVSAFADGGAFTNSIVSGPTTVPMALMGEAGDEAIMPLARDGAGRLGVKAAGGGSGGAPTFVFHNTYQVSADADKAYVQRMVEQGNRQTQAQIADQMRRNRNAYSRN